MLWELIVERHIGKPSNPLRVNIYIMEKVHCNYMDSVTMIWQVMWIYTNPPADMHLHLPVV